MAASHVSALESRHAGIEQQIHTELCRPQPDMAAIQTLKRRKLKIRDAISHH